MKKKEFENEEEDNDIRSHTKFDVRLAAHDTRGLLLDGGSNHIETSPLICSANHWSGSFMIGISVMKELNYLISKLKRIKTYNIESNVNSSKSSDKR